MKKLLMYVPLLILNLFLFVNRSHADGNVAYAPGPQISATGSFYAWPTAAAPAAGGILVNNGSNAFAWSNAMVSGASTGTATANQLITLASATVAQLSAFSPATVGQEIWCGNCSSNGAAGTICVSSGTGVGAFILSTGTICR